MEKYKLQHKVRIVTAASLFDGHDAAINIMRRIIQGSGAEVIHLGHNRSAAEIVDCAIQEDAQAIAITSYQGGHVEYFKYMLDLLRERGADHIKLFGGGGGTILPAEIAELHEYGITRIYSPDDGRSLGLQGMIDDLLKQSDFVTPFSHENDWEQLVKDKNPLAIAQVITAMENDLLQLPAAEKTNGSIVLGITGTGGAGKSSLTDEIILRFLDDFPDKTIGVLSVDPSKRKTGGALLGDRIRMNAVHNPRVYVRSFATREANIALNKNVAKALDLLRFAGFDLLIVETAGIGQSDSEITSVADVSLYVMTPEFGAPSQLEKIDMIDYADLIAINKFDKRGAADALRDVRKQFQRSRGLWTEKTDTMPVYGTIASQFNDSGTNSLYRAIIDTINNRKQANWVSAMETTFELAERIFIIPPKRVRYLSEISETCRAYDKETEQQVAIARRAFQIKGAIEALAEHNTDQQ